MKYHFWRVGIDDLGETSDLELIKKGIAAFDRERLFIVLSKMNVLLASADQTQFSIQEFLCKTFLDKETVGRINALAKARGSELPLVFDPQAVLNLQRFVVRYGVDGDLKLDSAADHASLGKLLLATNSLLDRSPEASTASEDDVTSLMIRNAFFNRLQRFDYALARYWDLYRRLPLSFTTKNKCDIGASFKSASGIEIEEMLAVGCVLSVYWMGISPETVASFAISVDPKKYFQTSKLPAETVEKALSYLTCTWDEYRARVPDDLVTTSAWEYSFRYELEHPIVRLPSGLIVPIDMGFLRGRVTASVYHAIVNHFSADTSFVNNFTGKYGELFEEYVLRLLRRTLGEKLRKVTLEGQEKSDALFPESETLNVIECKSSRVRFDARTTGDLEKYAATLDRTIFDAARQAESTIALAREGRLDHDAQFDHKQIRRYRPVFVIEDMLPQDPLIWSWYEKELVKRKVLQSKDVDRPVLLTCEELENLEPLLKAGVSLTSLIDRKMANPAYRESTFLNFLLDGVKERKNDPNPVMMEVLKEFFDLVTAKHFDIPKGQI